MRGYGIKVAVAAVIVIAVFALVLCSSSKNSGKYDGGTLVKAEGDAQYAFSVMGDDEEKDDDAVNAYAADENDVSGLIYSSEIEAYIDGDSENLVYTGKAGE